MTVKDLGSIARNQKVFAIRAPGDVPTGKSQDTISFDLYYLFL